MTKAFVFGKFLPFHKGHESLINFALSKCDFLTVLICCSDQEHIPGDHRKVWIDKTFEHQANIEVKIFNYLESELPNTSVSSKVISETWAHVFKKLFPDYTLVITSEAYGEFVAGFMNIQHIAYDIPRIYIPVSATAVRNDMYANWNFLPDAVKSYFAIKVVVLGTESTGKTILTKKLAAHFKCTAVMEAGREIIPNSNTFRFEDLYLVAAEHSKRINEAVLNDSRLIIIDTDIHITKSYAQFIFGKKLEVSDEIYTSNQAQLYLYLNNDVAFFQDGTRLSETERNLLDGSHREILANHGIDLVEITGNWDQRLAKAVACIHKLILLNP